MWSLTCTHGKRLFLFHHPPPRGSRASPHRGSGASGKVPIRSREVQVLIWSASSSRQSPRAKLAKLVTSLVREGGDTPPSDTAASHNRSLRPRSQTATFTEARGQHLSQSVDSTRSYRKCPPAELPPQLDPENSCVRLRPS